MEIEPRVVIAGCGGHGRVVLDVLRNQRMVRVVGFLDDRVPRPQRCETTGVPIIGAVRWQQLQAEVADHFVVAIGNNHIRRQQFLAALEAGWKPWQAVHPSAIVAKDARLGAGVQAMAAVIVNPFAQIGSNVILNTACTVDHDCLVADHAFVGPGAHLGGAVRVGEGAFLGIGALVLPGISIGAGATIGAGAVVTRDVPAGATAVGVPARISKVPSGERALDDGHDRLKDTINREVEDLLVKVG